MFDIGKVTDQKKYENEGTSSSLGYKIFVSNKAIMKHTIGDEVVDLKFKKVSVHSPFRRYYIIRNNFYLLRLKYVPKIFSLRDIVMSLAVQILFIIALSNRRENTKFYLEQLKMVFMQINKVIVSIVLYKHLSRLKTYFG